MNKFKFHTSASTSTTSSDESDVSDDVIPDFNVPSQIKISNQKNININAKKYSDPNTSEKIQSRNINKINENSADEDKHVYKSYLAQRTKELLEAFSSDNEVISSKKLNQSTNDEKELAESMSNSNESDNNEFSDSPPSKSEEDSNEETNRMNYEKQPNSHIVNMYLKMPDIPPGQRQKKLLSSIKQIYDFFDHQISVQSIIYAIHDHAGILKDTISTLNKYPKKYDNYSLHNLPNNASQIAINSYLQILK